MAENEAEGGAAAAEAADAAPAKKGKLKLIIAAVGFVVIIGGIDSNPGLFPASTLPFPPRRVDDRWTAEDIQ